MICGMPSFDSKMNLRKSSPCRYKEKNHLSEKGSSPEMKVRRIGFKVRCFWLALLVLIGTAQAQTWLQVEADGSETPAPRTFAAPRSTILALSV